MNGRAHFDVWSMYEPHYHSDCAACHSKWGAIVHGDAVIVVGRLYYHPQCAPRTALIIATLRNIVTVGIDRHPRRLPY
jgi:hypothetical protein